MGQDNPNRRAHKPWKLLLALVCILLVVVAGTVQVAHAHEDTVNHADCALCAAAHITVHLAQTPAPALVATVVSVLDALPRSVLPCSLSTFALFTRPPPVAVVSA
jgi:hypothetical protein